MRNLAAQIASGLGALGPGRVIALALIGALTVAGVIAGSMWLGRADHETLYTGLDRGDVGRIGAALTEAGIPFDVSAEGDAVTVPIGQAGGARMLLAERGLPASTTAGYELFDQLGSLGLTSFMQEVTRVRALEGEIARTVQLMNSVRSARVHLVMPDEGSFRRDARPPSASVVLRTDMNADLGAARAIRHLVAAAVPGMSLERVTVLSTDGTLIAGGDGDVAAPANMIGLEAQVGQDIEDAVRQTLAPYLGRDSFRVSVAARLNTDRQRISETIFDPESRIERSTRIIRESEEAENRSSENATTVEQNLPEEELPAAGGEQSVAANERREELTNYELSTRIVETVKDGYAIDRLSIAVVIDRAQLVIDMGEDPDDTAVDERLETIRRLVMSAAGVEEGRGDTLEVSAVEFIAARSEGEAMADTGPTFSDLALRHSGQVINGVVLLAVAAMLIFGLRPVARAITGTAASATPPGLPGTAGGGAPAGGEDRPDAFGDDDEELGDPNLIGDLTNKLKRSPQKRLTQMVDYDEDRVVAILRQWLHKDRPAA